MAIQQLTLIHAHTRQRSDAMWHFKTTPMIQRFMLTHMFFFFFFFLVVLERLAFAKRLGVPIPSHQCIAVQYWSVRSDRTHQAQLLAGYYVVTSDTHPQSHCLWFCFMLLLLTWNQKKGLTCQSCGKGALCALFVRRSRATPRWAPSTLKWSHVQKCLPRLILRLTSAAFRLTPPVGGLLFL